MKFILACKIMGLVHSTPFTRNDLSRTCVNKYEAIYEEIVRNPNEAPWELEQHGTREVAVKKGCQRNTWDIEFCAQVCELQTGDVCEYMGGVGSDRCNEGLECQPVGNQFKCEPVLLGDDYYPSYSSDSSSFGDWFGF